MEVAALVKKRNLHKGRLSKIQTTVNKCDTDNPLSETVISSLLEDLASIKLKVEDIQEEIAVQCSDSELDAQIDVSEWFQNKIIDVKTKLLSIREAQAQPVQSSQVSSVKLPSIELPSFDGKYEGWQSFQDLFVATVENNKSLSGAQKLQYLKSCLKGEAANLVKSFTITDQNYREAWGLLTDRYDNKRELVHSIIKRLCNQQPVKSESAVFLQKLLDVTSECIRSLKVMGRPVEQWDDIIVFLVVEKMDPESRREWAMSLKGSEPPTFQELSSFLEIHIRGLNASRSQGPVQPVRQQTAPTTQRSFGGDRRQTSSLLGTTQSVCPVCKSNHLIHQCSQFRTMSVPERKESVRKALLCYNCLRPDHGVRYCTSRQTCRHCSKRHHLLLHMDPNSESEVASRASQTRSISSNHCAVSQVLLKTALVKVTDYCGKERVLRVLLDDGSQGSFITEACAKSLGLRVQKTDVVINGISSAPVCTVRGQINVELASLVQPATVTVDALIVPKVTGTLPRSQCIVKSWPHIIGLQLADPMFHQPSKVDMLLGGDVMASILKEGIRTGPRFTPLAQNSIFGWVLCGPASATREQLIQVNYADVQLDTVLHKFWELEELPAKKHLTKTEQLCEQKFVTTHVRNDDGRYIVKLPFNSKVNELGSSREQAVCRLLQLERRFKKFPERKEQYVKFMREYENLHHMKKIPPAEVDDSGVYYLPHHFVIKEDSTTTKLRVVFDGSAKTTSGLSLNDALMVGPTIQDDLFSLLLRFRFHLIAMKADITKMYRQFIVPPPDCNFQRIVWRESPTDPIQDFVLTTVTYGTASAPFLATRCLQQLAIDSESSYPEASRALSSDMYVDDLMSGESSTERARNLQREITQAVNSGGMEIRKWSTNDPEVLKSIPIEFRESESSLNLDTDCTIKALGVRWNPANDVFEFSVNSWNKSRSVTKRKLLSELAKVFDPLGWLSPTTIRAKLMFQELWKEPTGWDEILSEELQDKWNEYQSELGFIRNIAIPRCVVVPELIDCQLHGFCDASEKAYAAAVYLRCERKDGSLNIQLVAARSKVAPIKQVSIPRLELCGAVLVSNLLKTIQLASKLNCSLHAWTDSTIVLKWLASFPGRWKTFVANRVAEIQDLVPIENWCHVVSEENPADLPSRGIGAKELSTCEFWWRGPEWLLCKNIPMSNSPKVSDSLDLEEKKSSVVSNQCSVEPAFPLVHKFSSLSKLKRVTAYCLRFIRNTRVESADREFGVLTCIEISNALNKLIVFVQNCNFAAEMKLLKSGAPVGSNSKLKQLYPFLDTHGVVRVGGRLQNSNRPSEVKHPIILPHNHHLTMLVIDDCHKKTFTQWFSFNMVLTAA